MDTELVNITPKAIEQIKQISMAENPNGTKGLRLAVTGGDVRDFHIKLNLVSNVKKTIF